MRKGTLRDPGLGDVCWWRKALLARGKGSEPAPEPEYSRALPSGCPPAARAKSSVDAPAGETSKTSQFNARTPISVSL